MKYQVTISQTWSETVVVTAKNTREAKLKAWKKYNPKKMNHSFDVESEPK